MAELHERIVASRARPLDAVTVSAHTLDRIYLVERVAPDHEVKIDTAWEEAGGSRENTVAALGRLKCSVAAAGAVADDTQGGQLLGRTSGSSS